MSSEEVERQDAANAHFQERYQWVLLGVMGVLMLRRASRAFLYRRPCANLAQGGDDTASATEKGVAADIEGGHRASYRPTTLVKLDSWAMHPVLGALTPVKLFLISAVIGVNLPFILVTSTSIRGPHTAQVNTPHAVALRCGWMAIAQAPAVFSTMGRVNLVSFLTGIQYQSVRFAHKVFACAWLVLAVTHWLGMTLSNLKWKGHDAVAALYREYFVRFGIVTLIGLLVACLFSVRFFRRRLYEAWLILHQASGIIILTGVYHHAPPVRPYTYAAIALWALERLLRIFQLFSLLQFRPRRPVTKARATLAHGAITLLVPFPRGSWEAGQHAYIAFPTHLGIAWQLHPFSIANVPIRSQPEQEMLFVMRVQEGMTARLAKRLSQRLGGTDEIWLALEGPYGKSSYDTALFSDVLLVAGGSGITHCMSVLTDAIEKAKFASGRARRIHLVWVLQSVEQSSWVVSHLFRTVKRADAAGIDLKLSFFVTRGALSPALSPTDRGTISPEHSPTDSRDGFIGSEPDYGLDSRGGSLTSSDLLLLHESTKENVAVLSGRPQLGEIVRTGVDEASGTLLLVVTCGPTPMTDAVRTEVARLRAKHRIALEVASFEF
ncbi:hypothetical protein JCM21900_001354 [Sporobolomyces salmonicolor]